MLSPFPKLSTSLTCLSTISPCLTLAPAASRYRVSPCPGFNSNYLFSFQLTPGAAAAWPGAETMPPHFLSPSLEKLDSIQRGAGSTAAATPRRGKYWKILSLVKTISGSWPGPCPRVSRRPANTRSQNLRGRDSDNAVFCPNVSTLHTPVPLIKDLTL